MDAILEVKNVEIFRITNKHAGVDILVNTPMGIQEVTGFNPESFRYGTKGSVYHLGNWRVEILERENTDYTTKKLWRDYYGK